MSNEVSEPQDTWPPAPDSQTLPPAEELPPDTPQALQLGIASALLSPLFTLWVRVQMNPFLYPPALRHVLLGYLPHPHPRGIALGAGWAILASEPMAGVLTLAVVGLVAGAWEWFGSRRRRGSAMPWQTILGIALNLVPFGFFWHYFVTRYAWISPFMQ